MPNTVKPTILVQTISSDQEFPLMDKKTKVVDRLPEGAAPISGNSITGQVYENVSLEEVRVFIERIGTTIVESLKKNNPDSCSVEFSLGFKAGVKLPVLVSGEANGVLKIKLEWQNT